MTPYSLNIKGRLVCFDRPAVCAVVNATPDSFYSESRFDGSNLPRGIELAEIVDIGAHSTRPGASEVSETEEADRLRRVVPLVRKAAPNALISIDTYRASVARMAVTELGADIINDVAGGNLDPDMFATVAELGVPYILGHMRGGLSDMMQHTDYVDVTRDVLAELGERLGQLALMGVCDVIVDPGFGFSKTLEQNYSLLAHLETLQILHRPVMVGFSRKSMITKLLGISAHDALNGTSVLNTMALERGVAMLRVHDPLQARQCIDIYTALKANQ